MVFLNGANYTWHGCIPQAQSRQLPCIFSRMNRIEVYKTSLYGVSIALTAAALQACTLGATMPQQFTVMETGCVDDEAVQVSGYVSDLNGDERWTARCEGKVYDCIYSPDAGADCYQRME